MVTFIVWLLLVVAWNYGVPAATPFEDVFVAVVLYFMSIFLNNYIKMLKNCMPFEEMARRGRQTLLFGPMKPVGLTKPDGDKPYAVVQLRQDNKEGTLFNIVGFQTHLTFGEQKRIIRMIPGLEKASIVRYGVMHRNTFINNFQYENIISLHHFFHFNYNLWSRKTRP